MPSAAQRPWHVFCSSRRPAVSISNYPDVSGRAPERRIHHRVLVGAPAWLIVGADRISAECVDVSMGGANVFTERHVATGAIGLFELSLGRDRGTVAIRCEVVRSAQAKLGLRFLSLDRASLEAIASLL
jgi:hypothetical protein